MKILLCECLAEGRSLSKQHSLQIFCPEQQAVHFCFATFRLAHLDSQYKKSPEDHLDLFPSCVYLGTH